MTKEELSSLSDQELREKSKKLKKSRWFFAGYIGFLVGVLLFGMVSWFLSEEKQIGFLIPMILVALFVFRSFKKNKENKDLEEVLKERNIR